MAVPHHTIEDPLPTQCLTGMTIYSDERLRPCLIIMMNLCTLVFKLQGMSLRRIIQASLLPLCTSCLRIEELDDQIHMIPV